MTFKQFRLILFLFFGLLKFGISVDYTIEDFMPKKSFNFVGVNTILDNKTLYRLSSSTNYLGSFKFLSPVSWELKRKIYENGELITSTNIVKFDGSFRAVTLDDMIYLKEPLIETSKKNAALQNSRIFFIGDDTDRVGSPLWNLYRRYALKFGIICCVEMRNNSATKIVIWAFNTGIVFEAEIDDKSIKFFSIEQIVN